MMSEYLIASSRLLRGVVGALAGAGAHAGERDMSLWAIEWLAVPQAFILAGGTAEKLGELLGSLEIDAARMRANLDLTDGAIMAEAAMMTLAPVLGHEQAHELVTAASRRARAGRRALVDVLAEDATARDAIDPVLLERLRDPLAHLGWSVPVAAAAAAGGPGRLRAPERTEGLSP